MTCLKCGFADSVEESGPRAENYRHATQTCCCAQSMPYSNEPCPKCLRDICVCPSEIKAGGRVIGLVSRKEAKMKDSDGKFVVDTQTSVETVKQCKVTISVRDIYEFLKEKGVELPHWENTNFYLEDTDIKTRGKRIGLSVCDFIIVWWEEKTRESTNGGPDCNPDKELR
ncbi:hypothetical protein KAR91_22975 [Candidatus Pacearchaeota archaeon]|nr:hypothetical protein [Candidatus Pacearchaeota archaeon]